MKGLRYPTVLKDRNFVLLFAGQTVSSFGNNMYTLALLWNMQTLTHGQADSALLMGMVLAAGIVPRVIASPLAGALVDRWPKRVSMLVTDVIRALLLAVLAVLVLTGHVRAWELIGFNFVLQAVGMMFQPAATVVVKEMVTNERLLQANSIQNVGLKVTEIFAPAVAGLLIGLSGDGWVFVIDAATFVVSFLSLVIIRAPEPKRTVSSLSPSSLYADVQQGMKIYLDIPYARALTPFVLLFNFPMMAMEFMIVRLVADTLHHSGNHGALLAGLLNTSLAVGELCGSFLQTSIPNRWRREHVVIVCLSASALCIIGVGLSASAWTMGLLLFFAGIAMITANTLFFTGVQMAVPSESLGRVFALLIALFNGEAPLSQLIFGGVAAFMSSGRLVSLLGAIGFVCASSAWLNPLVRHPASNDTAPEESVQI